MAWAIIVFFLGEYSLFRRFGFKTESILAYPTGELKKIRNRSVCDLSAAIHVENAPFIKIASTSGCVGFL